MVPLAMIGRHERHQGAPEMDWPEDDQAVQTLFLDGSHKAFRTRVAIGGAVRRLDHTDSGGCQRLAKRRAPFRVSVAEEYGDATQAPVLNISRDAGHLDHEGIVPVRGGTEEVNSTGRELDDEEGVVGDQTPRGPDLGGELVGV